MGERPIGFVPDGFVPDAAASAPRKPAATEDYLPAPKSFLDNATSFVKNFAATVNPLPALEMLYDAQRGMFGGDVDAALRSGQRLRGMGTAQVEQFKKAKDAYDQGRISEAVGHTVAGALPLMGPAAASAGEQIGSGDVAGGLGTAAGILGGVVAPEVIRRAPAVRIGGGMASRDAAVARAVETGRSMGVPIDAATATQNPFVQGVQKLADESMLGQFVGQRAKATQQAALGRMGETLAGQAHPVPVTAAEAGEVAQQGLRDVVSGHRTAANEAYTKLREIEARPENVVEYQPPTPEPRANAPYAFTTKPNPTVDDLFSRVLEDARESGYSGKVGDLRAKFDERVGQARSLKADTEGAVAEYGDAALLKSIRDAGGLRMFDKDFSQGIVSRLSEAADNVKGFFKGQRVYTENGLAMDAMVEHLRQDPRWAAKLAPDADLHEVLRDIAAKGQTAPTGNLQHYLRGAGVEPGKSWWMEDAPTQRVPMAVDITETKAALKPIYDKLAAEHAIVPFASGSGKGSAFVALDRLINGPDVAPLSVADAALSDLKRMARSSNPDLRTAGQGIAAKAVENLHKAVSEAAERAGPEAVTALEEGRTATKAKYAAADILKKLEGKAGTKSGGTAYRGLIAEDAAPHLREVLREAPQAKPLVARSVLDGIMGNQRMGADARFTAWQRIGPETKALLYSPEHIRALDDFFALQKQIAFNPNRSGSGTILAKAAELTGKPVMTLTAPMVSALLHSDTGVRLLTRGFRLPSAAPAARAAWVSAVGKALADTGGPTLAPTYAGEPKQ